MVVVVVHSMLVHKMVRRLEVVVVVVHSMLVHIELGKLELVEEAFDGGELGSVSRLVGMVVEVEQAFLVLLLVPLVPWVPLVLHILGVQ